MFCLRSSEALINREVVLRKGKGKPRKGEKGMRNERKGREEGWDGWF